MEMKGIFWSRLEGEEVHSVLDKGKEKLGAWDGIWRTFLELTDAEGLVEGSIAVEPWLLVTSTSYFHGLSDHNYLES